MIGYIKSSLKILIDYCLSLILFVVFIYIFYLVTKQNFGYWLPVYSFVIFCMTATIIYSEAHKLAVREKRPYYKLKLYPWKGLVLGLIGYSPFILLQFVYPFIVFNDKILNQAKHLTLNALMSPLYWLLKLGGEATAAYIAASLVVPVVAMLGYMAGYYDFEIRVALKKLMKKYKAKA
jgi:hypothetical protein